MSTRVFILSGTSWTVPSDWVATGATIECVGPGGYGASGYPQVERGTGGQGGGYGKVTSPSNINVSDVLVIQIGARDTTGTGGSPTFLKNNLGTIIVQGDLGRHQPNATSSGYTQTNTGGVTASGGDGIGPTAGGAASGGGAAGGPSGNGGNGSNTSGNNGGAGGATASGTSGGAGGVYVGGAGGAGSHDALWDVTHGIGSGGGGGAYQPGSSTLNIGGAGGGYGGGGGGAGETDGANNFNVGAGGPGIIVITYTPSGGGGSTKIMRMPCLGVG